MLRARDCLHSGFKFKFGSGDSSFWNDAWLFPSPLGPQLAAVHVHDTDLQLRDVFVNGHWNLDMLHTALPQEWTTAITALSPLLAPSVHDSWVWSVNSTGMYSVKTAYQWLLNPNGIAATTASWAWIWRLKLPANVVFFVWQLCQKSLPTKEVLHRRNVLGSATCALCQLNDESLHHCLFACSHAQEVWHLCAPAGFILPMADFEPLPWIHDTVTNFTALPIIIMWKVWCARNAFVFENKPFRSAVVAGQVYGLWRDIVSAYGVDKPIARSSSGLSVSWVAPPQGWVALNVDGSAQIHPPAASYGGVIRDHDGLYLRGFYASLGATTIMHAELCAILRRLELCWEMGYRNILCYTDSTHSLHLINNAVVEFQCMGMK